MADILDKDIEGLLTELSAGKVIGARGEDQAYNSGVDRAIQLVKKYREGRGLFQDPKEKPCP